MKKKIVVIGGGIAGISAALTAINSGYDVSIIESSNNFGGRINSNYDKETNDFYDNGQHIMVGAYSAFLDIVKLLGAYDKLYIQEKFEVCYKDSSGITPLKSILFNNQLGFLLGLLSFPKLTFVEKLNIIKFVFLIKSNKFIDNNEPFIEILIKYNQSFNAIRILWEPLCLATLNTPIYDASTLVITNVLKQSFFAGGINSKIIIPKVGLSDLIQNFEEYFLSKGGVIIKNHSLKEVIIENNKISEIKLTKELTLKADYFISALSLNKYNHFFPNNIELLTSPIISAYLWYDTDFIDEKFLAVLDKKIQWIFNKRKLGFTEGVKEFAGYYSIVISDANDLFLNSNQELEDIIISEINELFPQKKTLLKCKIIKEKNATILADTNSIKIKREYKNNINNLYIAGDWNDLGLPSTIETSARSGVNAVKQIINS